MTLRGRSTSADRASRIADAILALAEPWRTRFIQLVARYAGVEGAAASPSRADIVAWLEDEDVNEKIRLMLKTWTHSG